MLDLKREQANTTFYGLKKPKDAPMQSHVNQFTKPQQEVNYHRKSPLSDVDVNLAFLRSLGNNWCPFQQLLGSRIHPISPRILFAKALAFEASKPPASAGPLANALNTKYKHKSKPYDCLSQAFQQFPGGKKCRYCRRNGHLIEECLEKRWKITQANDENEESQPYWRKDKSASQSDACQPYWQS
jgi:hypothetical protein